MSRMRGLWAALWKEILGMDVVLVVAGLVALIAGGELLVRNAVHLARALGISAFVIGLTIVGFGTSAPELVTSLQAAWIGAPGIALGNVVGSNIGNMLLIVGVAALLAPIAVERNVLMRDGIVLLLATGACAGLIFFDEIGRLAGAALFAALLIYLGATFLAQRRGTAASEVYENEAAIVPDADVPIWRAVSLLFLGLVVTILGARLLVQGAVGVAQWLGFSDAVIGLTVVAIGTSMPELVTSVLAARKGQSDVAFGNIIGSNIFNILGILGITAMVVPLSGPLPITLLDVAVLIGATVLFVMFAVTGARISRREGAVLLSGYVGYVGWLVATA